MKTITFHLDDVDVVRFKRMKKAADMTWDDVLFAQLKQWEEKNGIRS